MAQLVSLATTFLLASLADGTRIAYAKAMSKLRAFASSLQPPKCWFPSTTETVVLFITSMLESHYSPASVQSTLSGVAFIHKLYSFPDPTCHFIVKKIMQGASKLHPQCDIRAPITLDILDKLSNSIAVVAVSMYEAKLFTSMFTLMFHACLRVGEVTASVNNLRLSQVKIIHNTIYLKFYTFKHHTGPPVSIRVQPSKQKCPVKALSDYMAMRPSQPGYLFIFMDAQPISSQYFTKVFNRCLDYLSLDKKYFKPHSFRIGAATNAFLRGVSMEKIQQMGRWQSQAFRKYVRIQEV